MIVTFVPKYISLKVHRAQYAIIWITEKDIVQLGVTDIRSVVRSYAIRGQLAPVIFPSLLAGIILGEAAMKF